jgi:hypothetical protein
MKAGKPITVRVRCREVVRRTDAHLCCCGRGRNNQLSRAFLLCGVGCCFLSGDDKPNNATANNTRTHACSAVRTTLRHKRDETQTLGEGVLLGISKE